VQTNSQRTNANNHSPYYILYESEHPWETSIRDSEEDNKLQKQPREQRIHPRIASMMPSIWWHSAFLQIQG
jgi:hypothetical protein